VIGKTISHFRILEKIGEGGMGVVYKAEDQNLRRLVALKVLPPEVVGDEERRLRFLREARAAAAVTHPNIATVHEVGEAGGTVFIAMELVDGKTLRTHIDGRPLPIKDALRIVTEIAEALAQAHQAQVIHRDLKPDNVIVAASGHAKILDFGLAKLLQEHEVEAGSEASRLATISGEMTRAGKILGTAAYMSPEQARGKTLDKSTDVWSLACVLYEMFTGRRAFDGETASDCLAAILHEDPDWRALPRATPAPIRRLMARCLEKDSERRPHAAEVRREIGAALEPPRGMSARQRLVTLAIAVIAIAALAAIIVAVVSRRALPPAPKLSQLTLVEGLEQSPAWAPDGQSIAYTAEVGGVRKIFLKRLAGRDGTPLTSGDFDDIQPSWTPDGKTIAFVRSRDAGRRLEPGDVFGQYDGGDVWAVDIATRQEARLLENAYNPSFSPDGRRLAVDASWAGPRRIWITDPAGHNPQQATTDVSEAIVHVRPRWSPDGKRIVFQNIERTKFDVRVIELDSKEFVPITSDLYQNIQPVWSPSSRFIYFTSNRTGGVNLWRVAVSPEGRPAGPLQQLTTGAGQDVETAISADGQRLAFAILRQNADLWKLPLNPETGRPTGPPQEVVSTTREESRGSWSPDRETIAFNSDRSGDMNLWLDSLRVGTTRQLTKGAGGDFQPAWSPDGRTIAFFSSRAGNADIWMVDVATGAPRQMTKTRSIDINPAFSPDGRSLAFQSDRSGRLEVWVMGADGSAPRQLTRVGVTGHFLLWTKDGSAVVFRRPGGDKPQSMEVALDGAEPRALAEVTGGSHMSFSPDGALILDVLAHKTLWVSPLKIGKPVQVFAFDDPEVRIDYPVWSPDGKWVLFDRFRPQGAAIWLLEGLE
jgi:Tol biopolymer transport system component